MGGGTEAIFNGHEAIYEGARGDPSWARGDFLESNFSVSFGPIGPGLQN